MLTRNVLVVIFILAMVAIVAAWSQLDQVEEGVPASEQQQPAR